MCLFGWRIHLIHLLSSLYFCLLCGNTCSIDTAHCSKQTSRKYFSTEVCFDQGCSSRRGWVKRGPAWRVLWLSNYCASGFSRWPQLISLSIAKKTPYRCHETSVLLLVLLKVCSYYLGRGWWWIFPCCHRSVVTNKEPNYHSSRGQRSSSVNAMGMHHLERLWILGQFYASVNCVMAAVMLFDMMGWENSL